MSYCRWSSDGWQSDIYCYEDVLGGYTAHVAAKRRPHRVTAFDGVSWDNPGRLWEAAQEEAAQLDDPANSLAPIGLSHDGETFTADTPEEMADLLLRLRAEGYNVPQGAIDLLYEEAA